MIKIVSFNGAQDLLKKRLKNDDQSLTGVVAGILAGVKADGNAALCRYSFQYDGYALTEDRIKVAPDEIERAKKTADSGFLQALRTAIGNIRAYHEKQLVNSWFDCSREGVLLGQLIRPLDRVGIYVPGGKASYPSSVLMNAVPAKVAGVKEVAMVTPPGRNGEVSPYTLVAAAEAGVDEVYRIGGAQAVAALAYGTETIKKVDKITGPGNRYVTMAKRLVFGEVDLDMLAGPSEVLVIADSSANPALIAADLLAQAEHDEMAAVFLFTPDRDLALLVKDELARQMESLARSEIAAKSLADFSAIVLTDSIDQAVDLANLFAPEHLELMIENPFSLLGRVKAAGAVFLGSYSPEPAGDYLAGPNHVLPTGGTARFFSPLGVDQFIRRTSVISYNRDALVREAPEIMKLASVEGLDAHARAVAIRMEQFLPVKSSPAYDKGDDISYGKIDIIQDDKPNSFRQAGENDGDLPLPPGLPDFAGRSRK